MIFCKMEFQEYFLFCEINMNKPIIERITLIADIVFNVMHHEIGKLEFQKGMEEEEEKAQRKILEILKQK